MTPVINGLPLNTLRNDEYIQFMTQVKTINSGYPTIVPLLAAQQNALDEKMAQIDTVYALMNKSMQTEPLEKADARRDRAITGIGAHVDSYLYHFTENIVAAAQLLRADLDKYGTNLARRSYNAETAIITNIVSDWKSQPDLIGAVNRLGLTSWLDELDAANKRFEEIYMSRNKEIAANPDDKLKDLRNEANELYYKLRDRLWSHANINDFADPFNAIIREWNTLIDSYGKLLADRQSNKDDAEPQPTV